MDFKSKDLLVDGRKIKLQIWDTAGQERFRTITNSYYRGAHAIVIVFDLTKRESYEHVQKWMSDINRYAKENVLKFLIGNKENITNIQKIIYRNNNKEKDQTQKVTTQTNLINEKKVSYEEARALASQMKATYFNVSAKRNENINEFFEAASKIFLTRFNFFEEDNKKIVINKKGSKRSSSKKLKKKEEKCF